MSRLPHPSNARPRPLQRHDWMTWLAAACLLAFLATTPSQAMEKPVRIAVYQGSIREGDFSANLSAARSVITRAREQGSQFVVFPECFLSGYESRAAVNAGARSPEDPELQDFLHSTSEHDLVIVLGMARRQDNHFFNSALVIQQGRLLGWTDKIHLGTDDRGALGFSPGTAVPVYSAHGIRFAVAIGHDTAQPATAEAARLHGAELLLVPQYNEAAESQADDHRRWIRNAHVGLAAQLHMAVARADVVKNSRHGQVGCGNSFILAPGGEPLAEARLFRAELITASLDPDLFRPAFKWGDPSESPTWLRHQLGATTLAFRQPQDIDLRDWLENMLVHHRFTAGEISLATGLTGAEIDAALQRLGLLAQRPQPHPPGTPLKVLPYPGGRHPRLGFFDGAVAPQRETKVSVFPPWEDGGYVVVDVPEAIFSNLGLIYLAHTHIPTIWENRGIGLPRLEWKRLESGALESERTLPDNTTFRVEMNPRPDGVQFELAVHNGTPNPLTNLRVQNCVMLGRSPGFEAQTLTNKVFASPFVAARSSDARHWVITGWERCQSTWGNPWVPCIHADPVLADCPPGQTVRARGWVSFFEGIDVGPEIERLKTAGVLLAEPRSGRSP